MKYNAEQNQASSLSRLREFKSILDRAIAELESGSWRDSTQEEHDHLEESVNLNLQKILNAPGRRHNAVLINDWVLIKLPRDHEQPSA